jgi:N-acyl homoserine lactone hydrolase
LHWSAWPAARMVHLVRSTKSLMVLLGLERGEVLLAGDAAVHDDWLRSNDVQRIVVDAQRAADVRNAIRAFRGVGATVIFGRDLRGLPAGRDDLVRHRPELFDTAAWLAPERP